MIKSNLDVLCYLTYFNLFGSIFTIPVKILRCPVWGVTGFL
jgi:hypothetical protein